MRDEISVGVLVGAGKLRKLQQGQGGPRLDKLLEASEVTGSKVFFFSLDDVNFDTRRIRGVYKAGTWKLRYYPYPQAFYRRSTVAERDKANFTRLLSQLRLNGTVFLNYQTSMDKWEEYLCLSSNPALRQYLPLTWALDGVEQIHSLFAESDVLYIKARVSGRGKQVMRVAKLPGGDYICSRYCNNLTRARLHRDALNQEVRSFFGNSKLIAQAAIRLLQVGGRNVDFRAEVQRDGSGQVRVVAIPVRIARDESPITTHSQSLSLEQFSATYPSLLPPLPDFRATADQFLARVYQGIEACYGPCGELGIDFGVDQEGRLWFIEANSQSAKVSFFNSYSDDIVRQSFVGLLEYGKYRVNKG